MRDLRQCVLPERAWRPGGRGRPPSLGRAPPEPRVMRLAAALCYACGSLLFLAGTALNYFSAD